MFPQSTLCSPRSLLPQSTICSPRSMLPQSTLCSPRSMFPQSTMGGGPRVVVSTVAFHARVRGSVPGLGGFKETKMFLPHPRVKVSIVGSLRDREVACSASDRQGSNFESCVWRTVSSQSSHHPQEVLLAQFSLYVHKGGLKPDSFHFNLPYIPPGLCSLNLPNAPQVYVPSIYPMFPHVYTPPPQKKKNSICFPRSMFLHIFPQSYVPAGLCRPTLNTLQSLS